jgi:RHS repeat-associated protein
MIAKIASGTTNYFLSDRLSVRLTLDASGGVVGRQAHLPYGEDFAESGTQQKQHFTGYERDSETGADYAVNRQYNQGVGRFNRVDPKPTSSRREIPQTWNRYNYTGNNPINRMDPDGLDWEEWLGDLIPGCGSIIPIDNGSRSIGMGPDIEVTCPEEPYTAPPDPIRLPLSRCKVTPRITPNTELIGHYSPGNHRGNTTTIGPGANVEQDGFMWYLFEVSVKLPRDDQDPNDWMVNQLLLRTGYVTIIYDGGPHDIDKSLLNNPDKIKEKFMDTTHNGFFYWEDAPDMQKIDRDPNGVRRNVVSGFIVFTIALNLLNKKDSRRSCWATLTLKLSITDSKPTWDALAVGGN